MSLKARRNTGGSGIAPRMKRGRNFVGVNHRQLSAFPRRMQIHAVGLEARAEGVPVAERRKEHDALSVRETRLSEPADGAVEEILILIELDDVIAWGGVRHHPIPALTVHHHSLRSGRPHQYPRRNRSPCA